MEATAAAFLRSPLSGSQFQKKGQHFCVRPIASPFASLLLLQQVGTC
jgi:hypothetical protein